MINHDLFLENLSLFARFWPKVALDLESVDCSSLEFCRTKKGELNLKNQFKENAYYHSNDGAVDEATQWIEENAPLGVKVLFIFGIGLGYYYDVLKEWLKADPGRYLIFLEDDLGVLKRFLQTEKATTILQDTQVIVHYFETPHDRGWGKFRSSFQIYIDAFSRVRHQVSALKIYAKEREVLWNLIFNQIKVNMIEKEYFYVDLLDYTEINVANLYLNLTFIRETYKGENFFDEFSHIPALICGAGPSINYQIEEIKKLTNKALIFASGTAINVLNKQGIMPHFGACLDPDPIQESRFLTNYAYEVPFFYHHRFFAKASKKIHGPRILITEVAGALGSAWFYKELGLTPIQYITPGVSTSNFCNGLAGKLKCDPIILVGLDLAYTDSKIYAEGVIAHPTEERRQHDIEHKADDIISTVDQDVKTKWDWVIESSSISIFSREHPDVQMINATERGMKILDVPSLKLKDVIDKFLNRSYDLQNWVHAKLQQSKQNISQEALLNAMETWGKSLGQCRDIVTNIKEILIPIRDNHLSKQTPMPAFMPGKIPLLQTNLEEEIAYQHVFSIYNDVFNDLAKPELNKLSFFSEQFDEEKRKLWLFHREIGRFEFLGRYIEIHFRTFEEVLKDFKAQLKRSQGKAIDPANILPQPTLAVDDTYVFGEGKFIIKDPELGINYEETLGSDITPESIHQGKMYYRQAMLHGPTSFYHQDGTLLARGWFVNDKRVGKNWQYYPSGKVYSLQKYKEGMLQGKQTYYYPTGVLKTSLNYLEGTLHGEVRLYYSDGTPKRFLNFNHGKLHGSELMWNEHGVKVLEAEYAENTPIGTSKVWFDNGKLAKQIDFHENPNDLEITFWNPEGTLIGKKSSLPQNPLDIIVNKSNELKKMLEETTSKLKSFQKKSENF